MKLPQVIVQSDFSAGVIDDKSVADSLLPRNAVRKSINFMFDRPRGSAAQRLGTTLLGSAAVSGSAILGIHNLRQAVGSNSQLIAASAGTLYYLSGGTTWTSSSTGLDPSAKVRFITYLDIAVALNGIDGARAWSGSGSWSTTGTALDVGNWPVTRYAALLAGRVFAAGNTSLPSRLYASSIVSASAVSWTSGNKTVDVFPNDGSGSITSIIGNGRLILVFKDRSLCRYDDASLQRVCFIGTPSHESVFNDDKGITYFFGQGANSVGFYATTGGYPEKISRPIQKWVEAISASNYSSVAGFTDGRKCYWSVGDITIGDRTYQNVWLVYVIGDQSWEIRSYANRYNVFSLYINSGGNMTTVGGDSVGNVQTIDLGNTDNGTPISYEGEFAPQFFGTKGQTKVIGDIVAIAPVFNGVGVFISIDDGDFIQMGSMDKKVRRFSGKRNMRGHKFTPKISGVNSGEPVLFEGFEYPDVNNEGYTI
jgi:hypothetical protein